MLKKKSEVIAAWLIRPLKILCRPCWCWFAITTSPGSTDDFVQQFRAEKGKERGQLPIRDSQGTAREVLWLWRVPAERANRMFSSHFPIALGRWSRTKTIFCQLASFNKSLIEPQLTARLSDLRSGRNCTPYLWLWFSELGAIVRSTNHSKSKAGSWIWYINAASLCSAYSAAAQMAFCVEKSIVCVVAIIVSRNFSPAHNMWLGISTTRQWRSDYVGVERRI